METKKYNASNVVKTKYLISFAAIIFAVFGMVLFSNNVSGQKENGDAGIQYPITELGNCADKPACALYCDKPENTKSCIDFAEKNNLMSKEEVKVARNFVAAGSSGPGGCSAKDACEAYCNDISRIDECVSYAEKNNLMTQEELADAKKIKAAIARGVKPPSCGSKKQCDAYCEEPAHMEECINFGAEAGFMQGDELKDAQKMLTAVKKGVKPLPCKGKEACDEYCSTPDNMEVCINFAVEAGFMNEEEKANSQKMLQAIKKGVKPPDCKGKEDCDSYCGEEEHFEECIAFSEAAGFMSGEDAAMARKTKGKGPGDCKGKDGCEAFCKNPDNQETCFNFAKDNGMIPEEDLKRMEEGRQGMLKALQEAPPAVLDCLNSELGAGVMEKIKSGTTMPSSNIGDKMSVCFEKAGSPAGGVPQGGPGEGGLMPPGQAGPGGCASPEECKTYCESHKEECQKFQPGPGATNPGKQTMPPQSGPGGCKTPEECQNYCTSNPDVCRNFAPAGKPQEQNPLPSQPPLPGSQAQSPSQGQYGYPAPGQNQPVPCEGAACQPGMMPGQVPGQPLGGNAPVSPPPLNSTEFAPQPPANMQPPLDQQPPRQPFPGTLPALPSSFNTADLLSAIVKTFSLFFNY